MNDEDHTYQIRIIALSGDLNVIFFSTGDLNVIFFSTGYGEKKYVRFHFSFNCLKISPEKLKLL